MSKNHIYNEIGKNIKEALKESLKSGDFSGVGDTISKSAQSVVDDVGESFSSIPGGLKAEKLSQHKESYTAGTYTRQRQEKLEQERQARLKEENIRREKAEEEAKARRERQLAQKQKQMHGSTKVTVTGADGLKSEKQLPMNRVGGVSSTLYTVGGSIGLGISAVSMLSTLPSLITGGASPVGLIVGGVLVCAFSAILFKGINGNKKLELADRVAQLSAGKGYAETEALARSMGIRKKQVVRRIKMLLKNGFFPEGRLDDTEDTFILTDEVYRQYQESKRNAIGKAVIDTTAHEVSDGFEGLSEEETKELKQMIAAGDDYITRLRALNDKIPGEVITGKLNRLEVLLKEIFRMIKVHPEQMSRMHELMDYYLPTMLKMVTAYEEYDRISEPGEDIIAAKKDIEDTLDTINVAFNKLLNNLFKDSVWDVTTDAQVLKTVLAQKGLSDK